MADLSRGGDRFRRRHLSKKLLRHRLNPTTPPPGRGGLSAPESRQKSRKFGCPVRPPERFLLLRSCRLFAGSLIPRSSPCQAFCGKPAKCERYPVHALVNRVGASTAAVKPRDGGGLSHLDVPSAMVLAITSPRTSDGYYRRKSPTPRSFCTRRVRSSCIRMSSPDTLTLEVAPTKAPILAPFLFLVPGAFRSEDGQSNRWGLATDTIVPMRRRRVNRPRRR